MIKLQPITSNINPDDFTYYVEQLNNQQVNRYLEIRFSPHTIESVKKYIDTLPDYFKFFSIINQNTNEWLGNIKLGPINTIHKFAEIGILVFQRYWNKGYGSAAIRELSNYAFCSLQLHKVFAGVLRPNTASIRAFEKAGFEYEYTIRNQYLVNDVYVDDIVLSKYNSREVKGCSFAVDVSCQTHAQEPNLSMASV